MTTFCSKCGRENKNTYKFCNNCNNPLQIFTYGENLHTGTILENRYRIINFIKKGAMGAVYKAEDAKFDNNLCAIKELILPYSINPQEEIQATEWFKREAKLLHTLHHNNLPKVSDYFINHSRYYLVMTFIEGEDLESILFKEGNPGLPPDKVVEWSKQILEVLDYLHSQKPPIIYRDIKPGNIMINKSNRAILIDFGIARVVHEASQIKKTSIGTEGYAPPEQYRGNADLRSDLYALGATMHHLLTGKTPIPFKFEPLRNINPKLSCELEMFIMKALKDDSLERFISAKDMLQALSSLVMTNKYEIKKYNSVNQNITNYTSVVNNNNSYISMTLEQRENLLDNMLSINKQILNNPIMHKLNSTRKRI